MNISGLFSGFGSMVGNMFSPTQVALNTGSIPITKSVVNTTVPPAGSTSFLDTALNAITKIAGTGLGIYQAATQKTEPQYVTGTPQVLNLTTTTPSPGQPNNVQVYPASNTISVTSPAGTQGSQATTNSSSMMWLVIALLAIVAIAIMRKG